MRQNELRIEKAAKEQKELEEMEEYVLFFFEHIDLY